jgi:DNA repair exonuclease SbcCD ATPase subunit
MPTRKLTEAELRMANSLLKEVRESIEKLSEDDLDLRFALRRKIAKELTYDERGKPMQRKKLKLKMLRLQDGKCAVCAKALPLLARGAVLDRQNTMDGYVVENVKLICRDCDEKLQEKRGFTG